MTDSRVVNLRHEAYDVRIDRRSKWGNPFKIGPDGTRDEVIAKYHDYILARPELLARMHAELDGRTLGCWCKPLACHGDILVELLETTS
jgi:hypothetical protein